MSAGRRQGRNAHADVTTSPHTGSAGGGNTRFQDQDRGGGAGGRNDQSGGASGSDGVSSCIAALVTISGGSRTPITCVPHFRRHATVSGHLLLLSQQLQLSPFSPLAGAVISALAQSMAPLSAASMLMLAVSTTDTDAHACATGASVSERAISIATMGRNNTSSVRSINRKQIGERFLRPTRYQKAGHLQWNCSFDRRKCW